MDFNSIDEDDVESLRLAALMTFKNKLNVPKNTMSSNSGVFYQNKLRNYKVFNNHVKNNSGQFTSSNRSFNKYKYTNVNFRRPTHTNNNLIAIIPTDSESLTNDLTSKNSCINVNSKLLPTSTDSKVADSNKVSTKFNRLENDPGSEESEDSEMGVKINEESDDGDVLSLGEEDEDLDDLDKLMDIMEAEIASGDIKLSKKNKKSLKQKNKNKDPKLTVVSKLDFKIHEPITVNYPNIIKDSISPKTESVSMTTSDNIRNSPSKCNLLKSHFPLRSFTPQKKSISSNNKIGKELLLSRSPRRSPQSKYQYSPIQSKSYCRSLTPRRSPRRLSPLRENNCSPRQFSPLNSRFHDHSPSPKRRSRSLSRDITPSLKRSSPLMKRSRSPLKIKSKSPQFKQAIRRSPSPYKKTIRSSLITPDIQYKDNEIMNDNHFKKRENFKLVDKSLESNSIESILEMRKRKFESNKPIELTSKKIILKKTNLVQVAIQSESKETQNEKIIPEIKQKTTHLMRKVKKIPLAIPASKNKSPNIINELVPINLKRVFKHNSSSEKIGFNKRPRTMIGYKTNEPFFAKEDEFDQHNRKKNTMDNTKVSEFEMISTSEKKISVEESSVIIEEEKSEKEDRQESSVNSDECTEEEEEVQEKQCMVQNKKYKIQSNDSNDLRTELKRRRALRLNMVQREVKIKPESFYPTRLLQSAIRGAVDSSSSNGVKRNKLSIIPELSIKTKGDKVYDDGIKSYGNVMCLKSKSKNVPVCQRTTDFNNSLQKGLRMIIKRNINVTDINQVFDVLITCVISILVNSLYTYHCDLMLYLHDDS